MQPIFSKPYSASSGGVVSDKEIIAQTLITSLRSASEKLRAQLGDSNGEHEDLDRIYPRLVTEIKWWERA